MGLTTEIVLNIPQQIAVSIPSGDVSVGFLLGYLIPGFLLYMYISITDDDIPGHPLVLFAAFVLALAWPLQFIHMWKKIDELKESEDDEG